jgi:hypothetical protein
MSSPKTKTSPLKVPDDIRHYTTIVSYHPLAVVNNFSDPRDLKYVILNETASITLPTNSHPPDLEPPSHSVKTTRDINIPGRVNSGDAVLEPQVQSQEFKADSAIQLLQHLKLSDQAGGINANSAARTVIKQSPRFTTFGKLPAELRNKIWIEAASNEARNIYAIEAPACHDGGVILDSEGNITNPADSTWEVQVYGTTVTSVLASCKGAYDAVMKVGIYKPLFQMKTGHLAYYINPEIDRINISSDLQLWGMIPCGTLSDYLANPREVTLIRKAALPLTLFETEFYWCIFSIESMVNLKEFRLVHQRVRHPAQTTPFKLVLDFELNLIPYLLKPEEESDEVGYRIEAKPVYRGYTHMNAMMEAFSHIADGYQHDRLMSLWPQMTQAFELVPHLKKITICIKYTS